MNIGWIKGFGLKFWRLLVDIVAGFGWAVIGLLRIAAGFIRSIVKLVCSAFLHVLTDISVGIWNALSAGARLILKEADNALSIRENVSARERLILGAFPVVAILGAWSFLTQGAAEDRIISPLILPSPFEVAGQLHSLWFQAELSRSILASAQRVVCGFLVGLAAAFPLGVAMGSFSRVRALFDPVALFGAYLPIPALVPLTLSLFGIGELQKIMFLALAFFVYLLPLFVKAVEDVDNVFLQTAYTLGATKWQTVRRVLFNISAPQLFQAMRFGFGVGWTYIILAEMVAASRGLGQIIIVAQRRGPREHIYLVLLVIVLIAWLTDRMWVRLGRSLFPYKETR